MTEPAKPKKKGAPKKADRKNPHPGVDALDAVVASSAKALVAEVPANAQLRWRAKMFYVHDLNQISTTDMAALPEFAKVGYEQIKKWCMNDGWVEERQQFLEKVRSKVELAVTDAVVQRHLALHQKIQPLIEKAVEKFAPHHYTPIADADEKATWKTQCAVCGRKKLGHDNPFYGEPATQVVNALSRLVDMDLALTTVVTKATAARAAASAEGTSTNAGHDADHPPIDSNVTTEEARVAAHAILRKRRAAILGTGAGQGGDAPDGGGHGDDDASDDDLNGAD